MIMNNYQTAKHQSNQLVVTEAENYQTSVNLIPNFAKGIAELKVLNTETEKVRILQSKKIKGITTEKENQVSDLIDWMIDISGGIHSYAKRTGNEILKEKINYKISAIEKMKFSELTTAASIVLEQAKLIPAEQLADEGISAKEITDFETLLQNVKTLKSAPREAIIDRSGYTETITNLLAQANDIITILDQLATQFKRKDPDFYLKYKAARIVSVSSPRKVETSATQTTSTNK